MKPIQHPLSTPGCEACVLFTSAVREVLFFKFACLFMFAVLAIEPRAHALPLSCAGALRLI